MLKKTKAFLDPHSICSQISELLLPLCTKTMRCTIDHNSSWYSLYLIKQWSKMVPFQPNPASSWSSARGTEMTSRTSFSGHSNVLNSNYLDQSQP